MVVALKMMASLIGAEAVLDKDFPHCCNYWNGMPVELLVEQLYILEVEVVLVLVELETVYNFAQKVLMEAEKQPCMQEVLQHLLGKTRQV